MCQAPLCPSSGAREYYRVGCCLWYLVLWFSSCRYGVELRVMCPVCGLQPELLMMRIVVPETCWASNKICNKNHLLHLVSILFPHMNNRKFSARVIQGNRRTFLRADCKSYWVVNQVAQKIHRCKTPTDLFKPQLLYITVPARLLKENQKTPLPSCFNYKPPFKKSH